MKLSEAIREGAKLRPQCFGTPFNVGSCALGAAYEATYKETTFSKLLCKEYPLLIKEIKVPKILQNCYPRTSQVCISSLIANLNDQVRWSREKIADWVEKIEKKHE